ncbi:MAG: hypothetical protein ACEPOV_09015 [Hyphomicrobiales bacterium]
MNKLKTSNIIMFLIISGIFILSCAKKDEITQEVVEEIKDPTIPADTIRTTDTVIFDGGIIIIDSIMFTDTIVNYDTIMIIVDTTTYPFDTLGVPDYNPDWWNDGKGYNTTQSRHNCYAYAVNYYYEDTLQQGAKPGKISGIHIAAPFSAQECIDAAVADGLIVLEGEEEPPVGWCKVALFLELIHPNTDGTAASDFHWFRRDKNGFWSNKGSETPVSNLDISGVPILDPRQSGQGKHDYFVTFMAVKSSSHQGKGQTPVK